MTTDPSNAAIDRVLIRIHDRSVATNDSENETVSCGMLEWLGRVRPDLPPFVQRHSRPPGSWIHEDRRARQSDRASAQGAQKADAQEWPVSGDEAAGALRETLRQAKAEAGSGQKETSQGDEAGLAP